MGHLRRIKSEYRELADRLERGVVGLPEPSDPRAWEGWREILEILFTPEDAALASRLPFVPTPLHRLATALGVEETALGQRLDAMCDRGVVLDLIHPRTGKKSYLLAPPVVGFFEFSLMRAKDSIPKKRMAEALEAYTRGDAAFAREVFEHDTVIGRTLVNETAISDEPLPDVLDWERATDVVGNARAWTVSLCFCRHKAQHLGNPCGNEVEVCLSLDGGAEFCARHGFGRAIERGEALDVLHRSREKGLVQIADNVQEKPAWVCNCCGCCCEQLRSITEYGLAAVNHSGFETSHDASRCVGCSRCARACQIGAITMAPVRIAGQQKSALRPHVDRDVCIGCGVCAHACNKEAMRMVRSAERPHVPVNTVERAVRQALERNRLADLLFDEGSGLGAKFLHRAVDAIVHLPPTQAVLASEQVRSRFVKAALARLHGKV